MEDPTREIAQVIHLLTQSRPSLQRQTIETYFTPTASFTHPFCRTGSFNGSRWLIWCIFRWYKILSPKIELTVESVAFDKSALLLYISMHQLFRIWFIPFHRSPVHFVTVLQLVQDSSPKSGKPIYYIQSQEDHYQTNEFVKFFSVFRIVWLAVVVWQFVATGLSVLGAQLGAPVSWAEENVVGGNKERSVKEAALS